MRYSQGSICVTFINLQKTQWEPHQPVISTNVIDMTGAQFYRLVIVVMIGFNSGIELDLIPIANGMGISIRVEGMGKKVGGIKIALELVIIIFNPNTNGVIIILWWGIISHCENGNGPQQRVVGCNKHLELSLFSKSKVKIIGSIRVKHRLLSIFE